MIIIKKIKWKLITLKMTITKIIMIIINSVMIIMIIMIIYP